MPRTIDHLVLGTRDLDATGALFADLGFTVGTRNQHPWGTENRLVQFSDETFLELITVADGAAIPEHAPGQFSFGAHVRDALADGAGMSMLALKGEDARADATAFAAAGLGEFAPFDFERTGKRADGSDVRVAFSLAFARDENAPRCGLFTCQQHVPENFWNPAAQQHANAVTGIARVTIAAENPSDHHIPLDAFVDQREMLATSLGIEITAGKGVIEVVTDAGFAFRYGEAPAPHASPIFAGVTLHCRDTAMIAAAITRLGLKHRMIGEALILPAVADMALALRFEPAGMPA